jgi:hypothetical protein
MVNTYKTRTRKTKDTSEWLVVTEDRCVGDQKGGVGLIRDMCDGAYGYDNQGYK